MVRFSSPALTAFAASLSPTFLLSLLTAVNILNYVDRGIVPGAFDSLGAFIRADLGVVSTDVQVGMLQSFYIVGYALASVSFGHLVHFYGAFQLVAVGLFLWVLSVLLCGIAPHFWVLVLGRIMSGVGEGSFQTVVPPFIDDHAPPAKRGLWLAVFFCAIPVGTALGNVYGGLVASSLSWRWAFALEGLAMVPAVVLIWHLPVVGGDGPAANPPSPAGGVEARSNAALAAAAVAVGDSSAAMRLAAASPLRHAMASVNGGGEALTPLRLGGDGEGEEEGERRDGSGALPKLLPAPSFMAELRMLLFDPLFMSVTLGYAGFAAVLAGLGSFGPAIVLGLGLVNSQAQASLLFGVCVSISGIVGTPLGGLLLDWGTHRAKRWALKHDPLLTAQLGLVPLGAQAGARLGGGAHSLGGGSLAVQVAALTPHAGSRWGTPRGSAPSSPAPDGAYRPLSDVEMTPNGGRPPRAPRSAPAQGGGAGAAPTLATASSALMDSPTREALISGGAAALDSSNPFETDLKLLVALPQASLMTFSGALLCAAGVILGAGSPPVYFGLLTVGAGALCSTTAGVNQAVMASVPARSRAFAVGISTLLTHAFGDVPAPLVIGVLANALSPVTCRGGGGGGGGDDAPPPLLRCADTVRDAGGLRETLLLVCTWLAWPVVLWAAAWGVAGRRARARRAAAAEVAGVALTPGRLETLLAALRGVRLPRMARLDTLVAGWRRRLGSGGSGGSGSAARAAGGSRGSDALLGAEEEDAVRATVV